MKEMTYKTKLRTREELLHRIMDAAAYIREHLKMIQRAVISCLEQALKTVVDILNSYKISIWLTSGLLRRVVW
jgi:hypothetical protein